MLAIESIAQQIEDMKKRVKLLNSATIKRLAQKHPDAEISIFSSGLVDLSISLDQYYSEVEAFPYFDISTLPGVQADHFGYEYHADISKKTYRIDGRDVDVRVRIRASQPYTPEEKDLLRAIGKIQMQESKYETLVCGI